MLIVSIFSACIMQHAAGFFLAPARKTQQDAVVHHPTPPLPVSGKDMEFPLAEFKEYVGEEAATSSCKSWIGTYGLAAQAGCKQNVLLDDPKCDSTCKDAVRKDAEFVYRRCAETCERGSKLALKSKSSKSKSAWANAFSKVEEKFTVEEKSKKDQKVRKDRYDKRLQQREENRADKKRKNHLKDIEEQELKDAESEAKRKSEEVVTKKQKESIKVAVEGKKEATTVEVHADVVDANKDDTKEDDKEEKEHEHSEKVNAKTDESKKEVEDSKALHDKSEKKVIKAGSDEDAQAQVKAEAMKDQYTHQAFKSKSWQKKVADIEAKDDAAKADKSWGTSLKPESGLLASIFVYAFLFA